MAPSTITDLAVQIATVQADTRSILESVGKLEHAMYGNGKDGMLVRVDRLEQEHTRLTRWTTAAAGSALAAVTSLVTSIFKS